MDLFSFSNGTYSPPPPSRPRDWMLHRSLTQARQGAWSGQTHVDVAWDILRRSPQSDGRVRKAIQRAWGSGYQEGRTESGTWGIYSTRVEPTLEFSWGWSRRAYFDGERHTIRGEKVLGAVRRVMSIGVASGGPSTAVPRRYPIKRLAKPDEMKRWRRPPMSLRHDYQSGASPLEWPAPPPRTVAGTTVPKGEQVAFTVLLKRGLENDDENS